MSSIMTYVVSPLEGGAYSLRVSGNVIYNIKFGTEIFREINEGYSRNYFTVLAFLNKSLGTYTDRSDLIVDCKI